MARKLQLIAIDDVKTSVRLNNTLDVTHYDTFQLFAEAVHFSIDIRADLFIVDVLMDQMVWPADLKWANNLPSRSGLGLPTLGPMLALPFLRQGRPAAFYPVSNYWDKVSATDGPLVASLALLLSAIDDKIYGVHHAQEWLRSLGGATGGASTNTRGLESITHLMRSYRDSILHHSVRGLRLRGVQRACDYLHQVEDRMGKVESVLEFEGEPISIGLEFASGEVDHIELRSLFAEEFIGKYENEAFLHPSRLNTIRRTLQNWLGIAADKEPALFNAVRNLLKLCDAETDTPQDIREVMQLRGEMWTGYDEFRVRRIAMLFAWVSAASWEYPHIYSRDDPDYAFRNETLITKVYRRLGIHAEDPRARYLQLLTKNNDICTDEYRKPFLREEAYRSLKNRVTTAYSLGTQNRAGRITWAPKTDVTLTEEEINLCRDYARDELNWTNKLDAPWPEWLRRSLI